MKNNTMLATELYLYQNPTKIVWEGSYSDAALNAMCEELPHLSLKMAVPESLTSETFRYIINHTKKEYIDKVAIAAEAKTNGDDDWIIHPLALLVCETDDYAGGDYEGSCDEYVGVWKRDLISVDNEAPPAEYKELVVAFTEY